jgi:hypothetical protein
LRPERTIGDGSVWLMPLVVYAHVHLVPLFSPPSVSAHHRGDRTGRLVLVMVLVMLLCVGAHLQLEPLLLTAQLVVHVARRCPEIGANERGGRFERVECREHGWRRRRHKARARQSDGWLAWWHARRA